MYTQDFEKEQLFDWIKDLPFLQNPVLSLERMAGDASHRKYYRIKTTTHSFVMMKMNSFEDEGPLLPFLVIQEHLKSSQLNVPNIIYQDPQKGIIVLQDLGDITLLKRLKKIQDFADEHSLYEQVINCLIQLQFYASPSPKNNSLKAFQLRFDVEKLMSEVHFTFEEFYLKYLGKEFSKIDRKIFFDQFHQLCQVLAQQPTVFTHRDFHSRNLMMNSESSQERIFLIDFQDARMGPPQYDLASLLKDSYYQLSDYQVESLLAYYINQFERTFQKRLNRSEFIEIFDWMSIQRNFKAIGSFASFMNLRKDQRYLKYIGNTFENIRKTLLKYPQYSDLREILFEYYSF